jgi:hypothetical protein
MSWSGGTFTRGNGTYTGSSVWASDSGAGVGIEASRHDLHDQDLAAGIDACVNKDGSNATNIIETAWIQNGAVTADKLASDAVTTVKILNSNVTTAKIADVNVTTAKIADLNVTTGKLANDAVTEAKLDPDAASRSTHIGTFYYKLDGAGTSNGGTTQFMFRGGLQDVVDYTPARQLSIPRACKITHLSLASHDAVSSGSVSIGLYNSGSTTGQSLTLSSGKTTSAAITAQTFAALNELELLIQWSSFVTPDPVVVTADVWGHFTGA